MGNCILRNISQKYNLPFLLTFNRLKHDQIAILKTCRKEVLNISSLVTPCFTNSEFSGQYFNYKIILEFLNKYYRDKIPYESFFFVTILKI